MFSALIFHIFSILFTPKPSHFLVISDIHLDTTNTLPISYGQDTGKQLWTCMRSEVHRLIKAESPKFMLLLGDLPSHDFSSPNHLNNLATVLREISETITVPVFYVYGNEDSLIQDYGPFHKGLTNLFSVDPARNSPETKGWPALNANPDCSTSPKYACTYTLTTPMPADHAADMKNASQYNYYSAYPLGSAHPLRLILLNSVIFSYKYKPLVKNDQLPQAQAEIDWLAGQLAAAHKKGEAVYLAMHIPVGPDAFHGHSMWNNTLTLRNGLKFRDAFLNLVTQYQYDIHIVLSGHTHMNEVRALYASTHKLSSLNIGIPGITPLYGNNPALNVFSYDNAYQLTDSKTYYTTPVPDVWKSFSFKNEYGCEPNRTLFSCVKESILPQLPGWEAASEQNNPYKINYPVRSSDFKLGDTNWLTILQTIQVGL
jgi:sphingomyelin phosphodiesterase acid-like 3